MLLQHHRPMQRQLSRRQMHNHSHKNQLVIYFWYKKYIFIYFFKNIFTVESAAKMDFNSKTPQERDNEQAANQEKMQKEHNETLNAANQRAAELEKQLNAYKEAEKKKGFIIFFLFILLLTKIKLF